jgi:hypothetical protein
MCAEETGLAARATMIDQDVQDLVREIGFKTTKNILDVTRDKKVFFCNRLRLYCTHNQTERFQICNWDSCRQTKS